MIIVTTILLAFILVLVVVLLYDVTMMRDAQSTARQEYDGEAAKLNAKIDKLTESIRGLEERVEQSHADFIFPWRADLRRHGWTDDEIWAVEQLRREMRSAHPLAPVVTLWKERHPEVARKLDALEEQGIDSHLKGLHPRNTV